MLLRRTSRPQSSSLAIRGRMHLRSMVTLQKILGTLLWPLLACSSSAQSQYPVRLDIVNKSVVFLYGTDAVGQVNTSSPVATGFIAMVPSKTLPGRGYPLLVTAR